VKTCSLAISYLFVDALDSLVRAPDEEIELAERASIEFFAAVSVLY
jgi:hypothetical protein